MRRCAKAGSASAVALKGDPTILNGKLLGFFCSVRCPGDVILKTYDLARALRIAEVTLIGGFQSPMEKEFLDLVLRGPSAVVVCPARGMGAMRIPKGWEKPLAAGRLLLLSFFDDAIRRPTAAIAAKRNAYVAALAERLLIAHAERGARPRRCAETPWPKANRYSRWTPPTMPTSWNSAPRRLRLKIPCLSSVRK